LVAQCGEGEGGARVPARFVPCQNAETQVQRLAGLEFSTPNRVDWTSELSITLDYSLTAQTEVLPGYPVLWRVIESEAANKPLRVANGGESDRMVAADFGIDRPAAEKATVKADFRLPLENQRLPEDEEKPPPVPTREPNVVLLKGIYRGQVLHRPVPVDVHRVPHNTALEYPRPTKGAVTVQADDNTSRVFGEDVGVLSIVVDYSASMYEKMSPGAGTDRLTEARKALEKLLESIPDGPVVSVWMLGIDRTTNGTYGVEHLWPPKGSPVDEYKWNQKKTAQVVALLRSREPKGDAASPIVEAIRYAVDYDFEVAKQNFKNDYAGFKSLLILSDGDDNRYRNDLKDEAKRVEEIHEFLKPKFDKQDIQVNMIFFQGDPKLWPDKQREIFEKEYARARKQVAFIEELQPPGKMIEVHQTAELIEKLKVSRKQKLTYRLEIREGQPLLDKDKLSLVSKKGIHSGWTPLLLPGVYRACVRSFVQRLEVGPGDFLQVTLTRNDGKLECERVLLTDVPEYTPRAMKEVENWRFAIMNNGLVPQGGSVEMTALLENTVVRPSKDGELGTILLPRPSFVWLEASAGDLPAPQPLWLRWGNREWLPAPAWSMKTGRWPGLPGGEGRQPQKIHAWWITDRATPPVEQSLPGRTKGLNQDDPDFLNRPLQIEGDDIVIESVRLEKHAAFVNPETRRPATCLVVRLKHAPGKPVIARVVPGVGGFTQEGCEHRLYSDANKYTGIFWPVNESGGAEFTLQLMSLNKIKANAKHAEINNLPPPQSGDRCPVEEVPHVGASR
jgi:hypothetical protein